jgi:hypothetical protein
LSTRLRPCVLWWYPSPTAMAESPLALWGRYPVRGRVPTTAVGVPRPSSLLRAHAPDHVPPPCFGCPAVRGSRQVAASPCCAVVLPDVLSAQLSPRAWPPPPAARVVPMPVSSHTTAAFPPCGPGRRSPISPPATSGGTPIARLQSCTHVQARRFAHHPGRAYRYGFPYGSRGCSVRASRRSLPPYASDMLPVRSGPLTGWELAPHKMCSLVGCSPNRWLNAKAISLCPDYRRSAARPPSPCNAASPLQSWRRPRRMSNA